MCRAGMLASARTSRYLRSDVHGCQTRLIDIAPCDEGNTDGEERRDPVRPQFTDHCFTGEYPTPLTDRSGEAPSPRQLSLLGSYMGTMGELREVLGHVFAGRLKPVVDRTFPLSEIRAAHEYLEKSQMFGKVIVNP